MTEQHNTRPDDEPTTAADGEAEAHRLVYDPAEQPADAEGHKSDADADTVPETEAHRMLADPAEQS